MQAPVRLGEELGVFCRHLSLSRLRLHPIPAGSCLRAAGAVLGFLAFLALPVTVEAGEPPVTSKPAPATPAAPLVPTVIESGAAEMVSTEKETTFTFRNGVKVTATNMTLTCDHLEVVARRSGDPNATFGKQEDFKSLVATGGVRIVQNDREAICERAEVFPDEDKVVLSGNPVVRSTDGQYRATGPIMILERGERRARIVGDANERSRFTLPPLKDLGYEKDLPKKKKSEPAPPTTPTPGADTPVITVPPPSRPQ